MPTESGATDIREAAARLSGLLQAEQVPTDERKPEAQEEPAQEHEAELENQEPETSETELETSDSDDTEAEEVERYKVKVDGEELEVTLDELQKGYMMEANYRNKTTALNKEREAIEAKAKEIDTQLEEARSLLDQQLESLDSEEMRELRETDPDEYIRKYEKVQEKTRKFEQLRQKREKELAAKMEKQIQKEREALFTAFPTWENDPDVMAKESKEIFDVAKKFGWTDDELAGITDHRFFVMAHKAKVLDEMQKQSLDSKKVQPKPKSVKPGNGLTKEDRISKQVKDQRERLRRSGNIKDAVKLLQM